MKHLAYKRVAVLFLLCISVMLVSCLPVTMAVPDQQEITPSSTFTEIGHPTKTFVLTLTPTGTEFPLPAQTSTLTASSTIPVPVQVTNTSVPIILPTKTKPKRSVSTATWMSTLTPTPTLTLAPTLIRTAHLCAPPTPEPLWVNPVTSPTDQLSQIITVYIGNGEEVTITTESGIFTVTGGFNAYSNPALVEITLLPNTIHHLSVTAKVMAKNGDCIYAYTLTTTQDKQGTPLTITQGTSYP